MTEGACPNVLNCFSSYTHPRLILSLTNLPFPPELDLYANADKVATTIAPVCQCWNTLPSAMVRNNTDTNTALLLLKVNTIKTLESWYPERLSLF